MMYRESADNEAFRYIDVHATVGLAADKSGGRANGSPGSLHSVLLLALVCCLLAIPGIGASLAAFPPGQVSIVTRAAAAFGLGYAAAGGCAFVLSSAHAFWLAVYLPLWAAVSVVLWVIALRRASLREHGRAALAEIRAEPLPLLMGALVVIAVLAVHTGYLHYLGGPHYVYYLNGVEIANSHGVPSQTLEYGQSWPPATDKIFLDAFTGVLVLFSQNYLIGPGVLLLLSILGCALGLWAAAWELGLRRTGGLLPLLILANGVIFNTSLSNDFTEYRAEDFGRAVAFCALALGVVAIRQGSWRTAVLAGLVLAAASGSHLIPVLVVVLALTCVGVARLLYRADGRPRLVALLGGIVVCGTGAVVGLAIRVFAGGTFGLNGASAQSAYAAIHTRFDPTAYLYKGLFVPRDAPSGTHPYYPVGKVVYSLIYSGLGAYLPHWQVVLVFAAAVLAAVVLFVFVKTDLRIVGLVGLGIFAGIVAVALAFNFKYHVYIDATFGDRRLGSYSSVGLILVGLAVLEALIMLLERTPPPVLVAGAVVPVLILTAWLAPSSALSAHLTHVSHERLKLVNWIRAHTTCGARFLVNQRSEGTLTTLAGRNAISEGMGPFLRPDKLGYVTSLMLGARNFYQDPQAHQAFLRQYNITYVIVARIGKLVGYSGPEGSANLSALNAAPFLHQVYTRQSAIVYQVTGASAPAPSTLLRGPYLHCLTGPAKF